MADPLGVFNARAEARARLVRSRDLDLHEAVDVLQAAAEQTGVVSALGQDAVQAILATAFAVVHANAEGDVVPDVDPAATRALLGEPALADKLEARLAIDLRTPASLRERLRLVWHFGRAARGRLPDDELRRLLMSAANRSGLTADLASFHKRERWAREDVAHVVRWAMLDRDPFGD